MMIHEQYFYPDYCNYLSDFRERILHACKILAEQGYTGAHISQVTKPRDLADYPAFLG